MSLFFESIKILDGKIYNLKYHNQRVKKTLHDIYHVDKDIELDDFIKAPTKGLYKCKVVYSKTLQNISYSTYHPKEFKSFKLINSNIEYNYKSVNRDQIDNLFAKRENCDDIIIIQDNLIKDTSIANIALFDGLKWFTPKTPLLKGTQRDKLLEEKIVFEKDLKLKDLEKSTKFAIINAMIGFKQIKNFKIE